MTKLLKLTTDFVVLVDSRPNEKENPLITYTVLKIALIMKTLEDYPKKKKKNKLITRLYLQARFFNRLHRAPVIKLVNNLCKINCENVVCCNSFGWRGKKRERLTYTITICVVIFSFRSFNRGGNVICPNFSCDEID